MIDSHVHVWTLEPTRYPWRQTLAHVPIPRQAAPADDLLDRMRVAHVERAVLVQPSVYGWDNSYLCEWVARRPDRFIGVCLVDPCSQSAAADLRYWCADRGCRGVRINAIASEDASWLLEPARDHLWRAAQEIGVSVSLQMRPSQAGVVAELADRCPTLRIVVDYLGPDSYHGESGRRAVRQLGTRENIWFKIIASGPDSRESYPFADLWPLYWEAFESFASDRLVFGTDYPHVLRSCTYQQAIGWIEELPFLDPEARAMIAMTNAIDLWDIHRIEREYDED